MANTTEQGIFNEAIIQGKVMDVNQPQAGEFNYFEVGMKAEDEYSLPAVVSISQPTAQRPFAKKGDLVTVRVKVGGFPRKGNKESTSSMRFITNTLQFIELLSN